MDFSDELRNKISEMSKIDLSPHIWDEELNNLLMSIKVDDFVNDDDFKNNDVIITRMSQVFEMGLNIGSCGLTCRHFANALKISRVIYVKQPLIAGTKNSPNGEHALVLCMYKGKLMIICPTLKLAIPIIENSPNVEHVRILYNNENDVKDKIIVLEPTSNLSIPLATPLAKVLCHTVTKVLAYDSGIFFSETDTFKTKFLIRKKNIEKFNQRLLMINK